MSSEKRPLVLVADDHAVVRTGCRRLLEPPLGGYSVIEAESGPELLEKAAARLPDAVVVDLNMPGLGGIELVEAVAALPSAPRIVVFSMHEGATVVQRCLQAGALGYVSKSDPPQDLPTAVGRALAGEVWLSAEHARALASLRGSDEAEAAELAPREEAIMDQLARTADLPDIAANLGISYKTLTNLLVRLRGRFRVRRTADLVRIAVERQMGGKQN